MCCPEISYPYVTTETALSTAYATVTTTEVAFGYAETSIITITGNYFA
jgi:hypothetical protein